MWKPDEVGARGSLGRGELGSVGLDLRISEFWRAGHYDHNILDKETFEPPYKDPPPALVATNTALPKRAFAHEKRLLSPCIPSHLFKNLYSYPQSNPIPHAPEPSK
jgi:hypothetical protein